MEKPTTVLIAEDHAVTRLGIRMFLEDQGVEVVGEAPDGHEAVRLCKELNPDVVLMDVQMPGLDGIQAARILKADCPQSRTIMLTSSTEDQHIFASLSAGASGYCTKDVSDDRLLIAIKSVKSGDLWIDANVAAKVLQSLPSAGTEKVNGALSDRELDVLRLVVQGKSNQQIAKQLYVSVETVRTHIKHILEKMAVTDRTQAAVKAVKEGLI